MVHQRRPPARFAFRHLAGDRGSVQLQSTASSDAGRIPAGLRGVAESRLPIGLSGRQLYHPEGTSRPTSMLVGTYRTWTTPGSTQSSGTFSRGRAAQKQRFLGELFPAQLPEGATGRAFLDFFQVSKM